MSAKTSRTVRSSVSFIVSLLAVSLATSAVSASEPEASEFGTGEPGPDVALRDDRSVGVSLVGDVIFTDEGAAPLPGVQLDFGFSAHGAFELRAQTIGALTVGALGLKGFFVENGVAPHMYLRGGFAYFTETTTGGKDGVAANVQAGAGLEISSDSGVFFNMDIGPMLFVGKGGAVVVGHGSARFGYRF